jgi:glutamate formiminotransferase
VEIARRIAREIRESNGGLPGVRALGLRLPARARVQVSMNLCDPARTDLARAFDEVDARATHLGTRAVSSELIGLAPASALTEDVAKHVLLEGGFQPSRVLELALARP